MIKFSSLWRDPVTTTVLLSAFLPYLPGGLRFEFIVVPVLALCLALLSCLRRSNVNLRILTASVFLLSAALFAAIGSYFAPHAGVFVSPFVMWVRLTMPAILLFSLSLQATENNDYLTYVAKSIVYIAGFVAIASALSPFAAFSSVFGFFVRLDVDGVWNQANLIGRFTGIFNQPLEAGVFFSVALLSVVYLASRGSEGKVGLSVSLFLILLGGLLSLSKNFIFVGAFSAIAYSIAVHLVSVGRALFFLSIFSGFIASVMVLFNNAYVQAFIELYDRGGVLLAVTAGRFGSDDTEVNLLFRDLFISGNWFGGAGLGAYLPLDNGYLEYFYQGGIFSLLGYMGFLLTIFIVSARNIETGEGKLLLAIVFFIALASFGGPVVTAGRANVPLMLLVGACLSTIADRCKGIKEKLLV